jgi:hypothetical protein
LKVFGEAIMEAGGKSFEIALDKLAKEYAPDNVMW